MRNTLPPDHPQRIELNNEVHARPPEALTPPLQLSFLALFTADVPSEAAIAPIRDLAQRYGVAPPAPGANHFSAELGPFRVTWERHTEFTRYSFIARDTNNDLFDNPAIGRVPADWVAKLPGRVLVAAHVAFTIADGTPLNVEKIASDHFAENVLVGANVADGAGIAFTDFRIHADGFSRILVHDHGLVPRQAGRLVQRLLEIDAYRILSLLTLPIARELTPFLARCEQELAQITTAMVAARDIDEPALLDRLTTLEAQIDSRRAQNFSRFSAAVAYHDLVQRRIEELRESRIAGLQTFRELTERRLVPAMNTCAAVSVRQEALSKQVAQVTQLLATRVGITGEKQNQSILESLNRRAQMQLRLQETVEGLSVAAVTYYVVGLVAYLAKGLSAWGIGVKPDVITALSIPAVALLVAFGLRRVRAMIMPKEAEKAGATAAAPPPDVI